MAYSLNDVYRYLRVVMRIDGLLIGIALGLFLAIAPGYVLQASGRYDVAPLWPVRLSGGLLITLGVMLLLAAQERIVSGTSMIAMSLGNAVIALVLLVAYLQQELAALSLIGRILLVIVFAICLVCAVFPMQYVRAEYRTS